MASQQRFAVLARRQPDALSCIKQEGLRRKRIEKAGQVGSVRGLVARRLEPLGRFTSPQASDFDTRNSQGFIQSSAPTDSMCMHWRNPGYAVCLMPYDLPGIYSPIPLHSCLRAFGYAMRIGFCSLAMMVASDRLGYQTRVIQRQRLRIDGQGLRMDFRLPVQFQRQRC